MNKTFEQYLIMVGIRSIEFSMLDKTILENIPHFKQCYDEGMSPYTAVSVLTLISDEIGELKNKHKVVTDWLEESSLETFEQIEKELGSNQEMVNKILCLYESLQKRKLQ